MFPFLFDLPNKIKLFSIQKLSPISFIRFRRASRICDCFCEENKQHIKIRPDSSKWIQISSSNPNAQFLDCNIFGKVFLLPRFFILKRPGTLAKAEVPFKIDMSQENIAIIQATISGFFFLQLSIINWYSDEESLGAKQFEEALVYFKQTVQIRFLRILSTYKVNKKQLELVASGWEIAILELLTIGNASFMSKPIIKNTFCLRYYVSEGGTKETLELLHNLRELECPRVEAKYLNGNFTDELKQNFRQFLMDWRNDLSPKLETLKMSYFDLTEKIFNKELDKEDIFSEISPYYLGSFTEVDARPLREAERQYMRLESGYFPLVELSKGKFEDSLKPIMIFLQQRKHDYWLIKKGNDTWARLLVTRINRNLTPRNQNISIFLENLGNDRNLLTFNLAKIFYETIPIGCVFDLSSIYEELKKISPENIRNTIKETWKRYVIASKYSRLYQNIRH